MESGEQCVMTTGALVMLWWVVDNLGTLESAILIFQSPVGQLSRESGWTIFGAQGMNLNLSTVITEDMEYITVLIQRMLGSVV
jgi:hypothetical protein